MELHEIDAALDAGKIWVRMRNGKLWRVRRNGMTKTFPRKGGFRIPVKAGMRVYDAITESDVIEIKDQGENNGYVFIE